VLFQPNCSYGHIRYIIRQPIDVMIRRYNQQKIVDVSHILIVAVDQRLWELLQKYQMGIGLSVTVAQDLEYARQ